MDRTWDCIVVGGGAAGLSAALVLGRARRTTLLVDAGEPSNAVAHGIGGLLGHDGRPPAELYDAGRREVGRYPTVEIRDGRVTGGRRTDAGFELELADGGRERARRVLLATGMDYRPPDVPGLAPLWGDTVFHCPFCHGWEMREQPLAVLPLPGAGLHMGQLLRAWSDDVVVLSGGLDEAERQAVRDADLPTDDRPVARLRAEDGKLAAIVIADGTELPRRGLLVGTRLHQRSDLAAQLGATAADATPLHVDAVDVDAALATSSAGVSAAGDLAGRLSTVAAAIAAGQMAAAALVGSLASD